MKKPLSLLLSCFILLAFATGCSSDSSNTAETENATEREAVELDAAASAEELEPTDANLSKIKLPSGALLVSDDKNDAIYRISYTK